MKVRALVLFVLLLGGVIVVGGYSPTFAGDDTGRSSRLTTSEIRHLPAEDLRRIEFTSAENIRGEIRIKTAGDLTLVIVEIDKQVHNISAGPRSDKILKSILVETKILNDVLLVEVKTPDAAEWEGRQIGVSADVEILLPPGWDFAGRSSAYDFDLTGPFRQVVIDGKYGRIKVDDVTEVAKISTEYGTLLGEKLRGKIDLNNRFGLTSLKKTVVTGKPLRIRSERGTITLKQLDGPVDISVDGAEVTIEGWVLTSGHSRIATRDEPINIQFAEWGAPRLEIENKNAEVEIVTSEDFSAIVHLEIEEYAGGYIRTRNLPVKVTRLERQILEGVIGNGDGSLEVFVGGIGEIALHGPKSANGKIEGKVKVPVQVDDEGL